MKNKNSNNRALQKQFNITQLQTFANKFRKTMFLWTIFSASSLVRNCDEA